MNVEISLLKDNRVMLVSDRPYPDLVDHVEFYRDSRLAMLTYKNSDHHDSMLMEMEIPDEMVRPMEKNDEIIIFALFADHDPIGYKVPLVKVGNFR